MLYRHETRNCFADTIGDRGLVTATFADVLLEAAEALVAIRTDFHEQRLPMLALALESADLEALKPIAERYRRDFDSVVVLGTGGSSLGGQTLCSLADAGFGPADGSPVIHFIDNVDPHTFEALFKTVALERTGFIVISKSGGTAETIAQYLVCMDALVKAVGEPQAAKQVLLITEPGDNSLRKISSHLGLSVLDHDPGVGGRFSVLSVVAMLPAMIAGLDVLALRAGAAEVLEAALKAKSPADCEAAVGAAINISLFRDSQISATVLMPYIDRLANFGLWFQQLWAESLGKDATGTTPIRALGTRDQHSQLQLYLDGPRDKMFTLLTLDVAGAGRSIANGIAVDPSLAYLSGRTMGDLLAAEQDATAATLADSGCPTRVIRLSELNEKTLGALLMHFMLETMIAAHLLDVNAFDQPAVEAGKVLTRRFLSEMDANG